MALAAEPGAGPRGLFALPPGAATLLAVAAAGLALLLAAMLVATGGAFTYAQDDPYIHLALAGRLVEGHYGLNAGEAAAPSSSILYPFLLALLLEPGAGQAAPLLLNLAGLAGCMIALAALLAEAGLDLARAGPARVVLLGAVLLLSLHLLGLAATGLEHTLHVADTLACLLGIARTCRTGRMPAWLPVVLTLNPLFRYEGLAIWGSGVLTLWVTRHRGAAIATAGAGLLLVGGFSWWLHGMGLGLLPSSVLVKSRATDALASTTVFARIWATLGDNLAQYGAAQLLVALVLLPVLALRRRQFGVALFAALPIVAHLLFGAFGWFGRYEIYILALGWGAVLLLAGDLAARWLQAGRRPFAAGLLLPLLIHAGYVRATLSAPAAAADVYLQQFQMHRFAVEYWRGPVAVNDIGWVSYDNPNYVLDLWGLGSEAARRARRQSGGDPGWMEQLTQQHQVEVAMIYPSIFAAVPPGWTPVAELALTRPTTVAGFPVVTIYATVPDRIPALREALTRFARTLPDGARLTLD